METQGPLEAFKVCLWATLALLGTLQSSLNMNFSTVKSHLVLEISKT